jgi:protein required for attachment to host cells
MILPTGTTVAVADGETVRLFRNTGVKPRVHLVEMTAAPPAPAHSGSGAPSHQLCQPRWQAARRG